MEDIKPEQRVRQVEERYMACPLCDGELRRDIDSWRNRTNYSARSCDCGSWFLMVNSIGENTWHYEKRKEGILGELFGRKTY